MKKRVPFICALSVIALGVPAMQAASVLADAGFEGVTLIDDGSGVGKWGPFSAGPPSSYAIATTNPHGGLEHMQLTLGAANLFAGMFQDVSVLAGEEITYSGWHAAFNNSPTAIEIRIEWRDSVGNSEISRTANATPSPGSTYEMFSLTETAPAGADTARVVYAVQSFGGSSSAVLDVDDLSVTGIPEPASSLLFSLGALGLMVRRRR